LKTKGTGNLDVEDDLAKACFGKAEKVVTRFNPPPCTCMGGLRAPWHTKVEKHQGVKERRREKGCKEKRRKRRVRGTKPKNDVSYETSIRQNVIRKNRRRRGNGRRG